MGEIFAACCAGVRAANQLSKIAVHIIARISIQGKEYFTAKSSTAQICNPIAQIETPTSDPSTAATREIIRISVEMSC